MKNQRKKDRTYGKDTKRIFAEQKAYKEKIGKCEECGNTTCDVTIFKIYGVK